MHINCLKVNTYFNGWKSIFLQLNEYKTIQFHPSIWTKVWPQIFLDQRVLYKLWTWNCSFSSANQNKNNFLFITRTQHVKSTKNRPSNSGLIEETMDLSCTLLKLAESQKFFSFVLNLQNIVPNHYPPKEKMLRVVIGHIFFEVWAKMKTFLRLSYLYL